jgi:hypothetical protein
MIIGMGSYMSFMFVHGTGNRSKVRGAVDGFGHVMVYLIWV